MSDLRKYLSSVGRIYWVIIVILAVGSFMFAYSRTMSAACYSGTVDGRTCYRGYFDNVYDSGGTYVLPVIKNEQALPSSDIKNADSLYNLLRSAYNSSSKQRKTGAAFIYNTMMRPAAPGVGRTVTNSQWSDLYARLKSLDQAGKIVWSGNVNETINSFWQGEDDGYPQDGKHDDDTFYADNKNESGITIYNYENKVIYRILRRCGNPVGKFTDQLPPPRDEYTLTPFINQVSPSEIESGSLVSAYGSVNNVGTTNSPMTIWEITRMIVAPGGSVPHDSQGATASSTAPCQSGGGSGTGDYFDNSDTECKNVISGQSIFNIGEPAQNYKPSIKDLNIGDIPVGAKVCFALSVNPRSSISSAWGHSEPVCTIVGKKPMFQVWGGDVYSRGRVEGGTSVKWYLGDKLFGSWVEYGVFSVGPNDKIASGSGLNIQPDFDRTAWSKFTFANKNNEGQNSYGYYANEDSFKPMSNMASYFTSQEKKTPIGSNSVNLENITSNTKDAIDVRTAGDLTITGGNIDVGKMVVIHSTGTVTISGNINFLNKSISKISDIPQVIIIARNINIRNSVSQINAWLIAEDTINTCSNFSGRLTTGKCSTRLMVNGPVITSRLLLNRTGGAGGSGSWMNSGDPAEVFNLRPDAFLWMLSRSTSANKAQTVYIEELPPRF